MMLKVTLSILFGITSLAAQATQDRSADTVCSERTAIYPVGIRAARTLPTERRPRFEIRVCGSGDSAEIQLLGYSARQARPTLVVNTGANWLELLIQTGNALIVQALDGVTSSALFVVQFRKGRPVLVAKDRTIGGVSYSEEHSDAGDYVIITVPLKVYGDQTTRLPDVPSHRYRLRLDTE